MFQIHVIHLFGLCQPVINLLNKEHVLSPLSAHYSVGTMEMRFTQGSGIQTQQKGGAGAEQSSP